MRRYWFILVLVACSLSILVLTGCNENLSNIPQAITFSQEGGSYYQPIELTISSEHASAIHYTLDGSAPNLSSPLYHSPLAISSTTRLSAIAVDEKGMVRQQKRADFILPVHPLSVPFLDVVERTIYHVSSMYEYSKDDGATWNSCEGPAHTIEDLAVGDTLWVRHQVVSTDVHYLGEVLSNNGYDLVAGPAYSAAYTTGTIDEHDAIVYDSDITDGSATIVIPSLINKGNEVFIGTVRLDFYASQDPVITTEDALFLSVSTNEFELDPHEQYGAVTPGSWPETANWYLDLVDMSTLAYTRDLVLNGPYYIGYHITVLSSGGEELLERNNWTIAQHTDMVHFTSAVASDVSGAFKVVNSWGKGGGWEYVPDGAYYITFEDAIKLELQIIYTLNNFTSVYKPTLLAEFSLAHEDRSSCVVSVGVGHPDSPIIEKRLQSLQAFGFGQPSFVMGVPQAYPSNLMVMDISEFSPYIGKNNVFLRVDNSQDDDHQAIVSSFSVELHSHYSGADSIPIARVSTSNVLPLLVEKGESVTLPLELVGELDAYQLAVAQPTSRSSQYQHTPVEQRPLSEDEIEYILSLQTRSKEKSSRSFTESQFATGLVPMSEAELRSLRTITSLGSLYRESLPSVVDLSASPYFPPIGNQGEKGSCAAFSNAYYIHTYNEAREHGWDLSGAQWIDSTFPGYPSPEYQDRIMSPDFSYHLVSNGPGASIMGLSAILNRIGSATWRTMPYDAANDMHSYEYPWPTEEAFREAPLYRSREPNGNYFQENGSGFILLDSMEKVNIVQQLLASGYCLSTSVKADYLFPSYSDSHWLNEQDIVSLAGVSQDDIDSFKAGLNHAQTIVGYTSGTSWDPSNP